MELSTFDHVTSSVQIARLLHTSPSPPTLSHPPLLPCDRYLSPNGHVFPSRRDPKFYGRRHADRSRPSTHTTNTHHFENPVGPRRTCRALLGRTLAIHRINQSRFVRLLVFVFVLDHPLSTPQIPLFTLGFYHRASPRILHPHRLRARCCALNYISVKFSSFRTPSSFVNITHSTGSTRAVIGFG